MECNNETIHFKWYIEILVKFKDDLLIIYKRQPLDITTHLISTDKRNIFRE